MKSPFRSLPAAFLLLWSALMSGVCRAEIFSICSEADPPPWIYWQRDQLGKKTDSLAGFSVDLMRAAFQKIGHQVKFVSLPWRRCKKYLEENRVNFAMDVPSFENLRNKYDYSEHYNTLTPQLFYLSSKHLIVKNSSDLKKYRGCSVSSIDIKHYSLEISNLDLSAEDDISLIKKLRAGHCDYFIEDLEFIVGYGRIGNNLLDDGSLKHQSIDGAIPTTYHLVALKGSAEATLMPHLNQAIGEIMKSGLAAKFWADHAGPALTYVP